MNLKNILLGAILAILPVMTSATVLTAATEVLYNNGASFVVKTVGNRIAVTTFDYKSPEETCKMLQNNKISIKTVSNWDKAGKLVSKTC